MPSRDWISKLSSPMNYKTKVKKININMNPTSIPIKAQNNTHIGSLRQKRSHLLKNIIKGRKENANNHEKKFIISVIVLLPVPYNSL